MHFNPKVTFHRLVSDLDKEGVRRFHAQPWAIDYMKIIGYAEGEVHLDNETTALVQEGFGEIEKIVDDKHEEHERYNANLRVQEGNGLVFLPGSGDE